MRKIIKKLQLQNQAQGFTLIELLVVIAIIGLLASVILVSLNSARKKARAAKRVADLSQIAKALELYYNDNGQYPPLSIGGDNPTSNWRSQCAAGWFQTTNVIPGLNPKYVGAVPVDPAMNAAAGQNCYMYYSTGSGYKFLDYYITDMSAADIDNFSTFKDPARNTSSAQCGVGLDPANALSVYAAGGGLTACTP